MCGTSDSRPRFGVTRVWWWSRLSVVSTGLPVLVAIEVLPVTVVSPSPV